MSFFGNEQLRDKCLGEFKDIACPCCKCRDYVLIRVNWYCGHVARFWNQYKTRFFRRCTRCHDVKELTEQDAIEVLEAQIPWYKRFFVLSNYRPWLIITALIVIGLILQIACK